MAEVAVLKCESYEPLSVYKSVSEALDLIHAEDLFKKGMKVLIKPNILGPFDPSKAVTTHPSVIEAICRYLKRFEVELYIGESSSSEAVRGTERAFRESGIAEAARKGGAEFVNFDRDEKVLLKNEGAAVMKNITLSKKLAGMDLIINACKLKTHMLTGYTGAVKNMFGTLPGRAKINAHTLGRNLRDFSEILLDVYLASKPQLSVMDAIIGMEGNGPSNGKVKKTGLILASRDGIALDAVASAVIGFKPERLGFLRSAKKRGLVPQIAILGEKDIKRPYQKPFTYFGFYEYASFFIKGREQVSFAADKSKCKKCGYCVEACPQKAIRQQKGFPIFDRKKCMMCYCCYEVCPHHAIILRKPLIARMIEMFTRRFED